jgi:hypothetical protein
MMRAPHEHPADPLLVARVFAAALGRPLPFSGAGTTRNPAAESVGRDKEDQSQPAPAAREFLEVAHD